MTVFSGSNVSMTVLLHRSGSLSDDSLPADLQHVQYLTMVMLRRMVLYICRHHLTVLKKGQCDACFVQSDLFLPVPV